MTVTHDIVAGETETLVEGNDGLVGGADEKIDFRAALRAKEVLDMRHKLSAAALLLEVRCNSKIVDATAMPLVAGHDGGDKLRIECANKEKLRRVVELAPDVC